MKINNIYLLVILSLIIFGCGDSSETDNSKKVTDTDSTRIGYDDANNNIPSTELVLGTCYLNFNNQSNFIYIIDNRYCMTNYVISSYSYDSNNKILTVSRNELTSTSKEEDIYFKLLSGYDTKTVCEQVDMPSSIYEYFDISNNVQNTSFALMDMFKDSDGNYQIKKSQTFLNILMPTNIETEKAIGLSITYNVEKIKRGMLDNEATSLTIENKVGVLENKGREYVDGILNSKIETNYSQVMETWNKIVRMNEEVNSFIENKSVDKTNVKELIKNLIIYNKLVLETERLNQALDNEILPLIL